MQWILRKVGKVVSLNKRTNKVRFLLSDVEGDYMEVVADKILSNCMYDVTVRIDLESIVTDLETGVKSQDDIEYEVGVAVVKAIKKHLNKKY